MKKNLAGKKKVFWWKRVLEIKVIFVEKSFDVKKKCREFFFLNFLLGE